jgi:hypothetical protein
MVDREVLSRANPMVVLQVKMIQDEKQNLSNLYSVSFQYMQVYFAFAKLAKTLNAQEAI